MIDKFTKALESMDAAEQSMDELRRALSKGELYNSATDRETLSVKYYVDEINGMIRHVTSMLERRELEALENMRRLAAENKVGEPPNP